MSASGPGLVLTGLAGLVAIFLKVLLVPRHRPGVNLQEEWTNVLMQADDVQEPHSEIAGTHVRGRVFKCSEDQLSSRPRASSGPDERAIGCAKGPSPPEVPTLGSVVDGLSRASTSSNQRITFANIGLRLDLK